MTKGCGKRAHSSAGTPKAFASRQRMLQHARLFLVHGIEAISRATKGAGITPSKRTITATTESAIFCKKSAGGGKISADVDASFRSTSLGAGTTKITFSTTK